MRCPDSSPLVSGAIVQLVCGVVSAQMFQGETTQPDGWCQFFLSRDGVIELPGPTCLAAQATVCTHLFLPPLPVLWRACLDPTKEPPSIQAGRVQLTAGLPSASLFPDQTSPDQPSQALYK